MTGTQTAVAVLIEIDDPRSATARAVVSAAVQVFRSTDPVDVVLCLRGVDEPTVEHARLVQSWVVEAVPDPSLLPEVALLGVAEAAALDVVAAVRASTDPDQVARAVVELADLAGELRRRGEAAAGGGSTAPSAREAVASQVLQHQVQVARRDLGAAARRGFERRPHVVAVFQHRGYWSSVDHLYRALRDDPSVDFSVVALDTPVDQFAPSTARFLAERGWASHGPQWLQERLPEVDALVLDNPYDEFRPAGLRVPELARQGVRMVHLPYGNGAIAGALMDKLLWDLPLQRLAWRNYLTDASQRGLHAQHCLGGADAVRVLGSPKQDATLQHVPGPRAAEIRARARGRRVVLWNPHFRVEEGGWSTFLDHADALLAHAAGSDDLLLVVRPHFRLFPLLRTARGPAAQLEARIRAASEADAGVLLDEHPDYLEAFAASDAMVSDLSSLASEYLLLGRPLLYTRSRSGPGPNAAGAYFAAMDQAASWPEVAAFLDRVGRGEDPRRAERQDAVARCFPLADGLASRRIADDIASSLVEELHLATASATASARPPLKTGGR